MAATATRLHLRSTHAATNSSPYLWKNVHITSSPSQLHDLCYNSESNPYIPESRTENDLLQSDKCTQKHPIPKRTNTVQKIPTDDKHRQDISLHSTTWAQKLRLSAWSPGRTCVSGCKHQQWRSEYPQDWWLRPVSAAARWWCVCRSQTYNAKISPDQKHLQAHTSQASWEMSPMYQPAESTLKRHNNGTMKHPVCYTKLSHSVLSFHCLYQCWAKYQISRTGGKGVRLSAMQLSFYLLL